MVRARTSVIVNISTACAIVEARPTMAEGNNFITVPTCTKFTANIIKYIKV